MLQEQIIDRNLLEEQLGGYWEDFKPFLTPNNITLLELAYNLCCIYNEDIDLGIQFTTTLVDESTEIQEKQYIFFGSLLNIMIDTLIRLEVEIDYDNLENNDIEYLIKLLKIPLELDDEFVVEEYSFLMNDKDLDNKDRIISLYLQKYNVEEESEEHNFLLTNIKEVGDGFIYSLNSLLNMVEKEEETEIIDEDLIKMVQERIIKIKDKFKESLAKKHLLDGGQLGLPFDSLLLTFKEELFELVGIDTTKYIEEYLLLGVISDMDTLNIFIKTKKELDEINDLESLMKTNKLINEYEGMLS